MVTLSGNVSQNPQPPTCKIVSDGRPWCSKVEIDGIDVSKHVVSVTWTLEAGRDAYVTLVLSGRHFNLDVKGKLDQLLIDNPSRTSTDQDPSPDLDPGMLL